MGFIKMREEFTLLIYIIYSRVGEDRSGMKNEKWKNEKSMKKK